MHNFVHVARSSAIAFAIVAGATPALATNVTVTLTNDSKYNMHYDSKSGDVSRYEDEIKKGDSGDIVITNTDGEGDGTITYKVGATSSTYCEAKLVVTYSTGLSGVCADAEVTKSTNRSDCALSETKSSSDKGCHLYYTFDVD